MKRGISIGLAGVAAVLALLLAAPFLLPASLYKSQIEQSVSEATGRAFTISGPLHFSVFPSLAIRADSISLANPTGHTNPFLATADGIDFGIRLWPLFSGRLEITQIVLDRPIIHLEVDAEGHANWLLGRAKTDTSRRPLSRGKMIEQFSGIKIEHGRVIYSNLRSGNVRTLEDIDANSDITNVDRPTEADGTFAFENRRIAFKIKAVTPKLLMEEHVAAIDVSAASDLLHAAFKGTIAPDGILSGIAKIDAPSARAAATWLGARLPQTGGLGPLSLESHIDGDNRHFRLDAMKLKLDGMTAKGSVTVDTDGAIPRVGGALTVDHLDLNPYIERPHNHGAHRPRPASESWSDAQFTLDNLKKANADLAMDVGSLALRKLQLGKAHIIVTLRDAQLSARLDPLALYGGIGKAVLAVDARNTPTYRNTLQFDNVALQPFLLNTIGVKQIEGTGTIRLDVTSKGYSTDAIMHGINGKGSIDFRNGQLRGIDLGTVARTVQSLLGSAIHPDAFTRYSDMRGSFVVSNGNLATSDFQFDGPVLHMTGVGRLDIGNRTIDFKMVPQASAVIAKQKLSVGLPLRIEGPWKHVHYTADFAGLVNGVLDNLKSGRAPFKGLLGSQAPKDSNAPKKKHKNIGDALKNMLGIH